MTAKTKAEHWRAWRDRNPEKAAENARSWRAKNRAAVSAKGHARYEANREYLNEYSRNYRKKIQATFVLTEKLARGACIDCGLIVTEENHVAFDFDHRDRNTKRSGVSRTSTNNLAEEMAKCDLRCANCHRIKTWQNKDGRISRIIQPTEDTLF